MAFSIFFPPGSLRTCFPCGKDWPLAGISPGHSKTWSHEHLQDGQRPWTKSLDRAHVPAQGLCSSTPAHLCSSVSTTLQEHLLSSGKAHNISAVTLLLGSKVNSCGNEFNVCLRRDKRQQRKKPQTNIILISLWKKILFDSKWELLAVYFPIFFLFLFISPHVNSQKCFIILHLTIKLKDQSDLDPNMT